MCQSSPDTSGMNAAALASSQTAQDALNWYKGEMARTQGQRDSSANIQNSIAQQQLAAMGAQYASAQDYDRYNRETFRPLEQGIVSDAEGYDTPERRAAAAQAASADVRSALAGQQTAKAQSLARMGYDPSSASNADLANNALVQAKAESDARNQVESTGHAMKMDAASLGRNLPSAQATAIQTGTQAGSAGAGAASAAVNTQGQGAALMGQGYGLGIQGYGTAGNIYGTQAQVLNGGDNSGLWGAVGNIGGALISRYSSKKLKTPGRDMPDDVALDAVRRGTPSHPRAEEDGASSGPGSHVRVLARMSNQTWKYDDGVEDGAVHAGPYAEEARRRMGNKVAPGGKQIDLGESADFNGEAIRELAARADRLERLLEHRR